MNKAEFQKRLADAEVLIEEGKFSAAVKRCDSLNLDLVKNPKTLQNIAKAYEKCRRYVDAEDVLLMARDYAPRSRSILFHLCNVAVKAKDLADAEQHYQEFCELAPNDSERFILAYRLAAAQKKPDEELIEILETFKAEDPDDHWMFILAQIYVNNDMMERAIGICDEITVWFNSGKYVEQAKALKAEALAALNAEDEEIEEPEAEDDEHVVISVTGQTHSVDEALKEVKAAQDEAEETAEEAAEEVPEETEEVSEEATEEAPEEEAGMKVLTFENAFDAIAEETAAQITLDAADWNVAEEDEAAEETVETEETAEAVEEIEEEVETAVEETAAEAETAVEETAAETEAAAEAEISIPEVIEKKTDNYVINIPKEILEKAGLPVEEKVVAPEASAEAETAEETAEAEETQVETEAEEEVETETAEEIAADFTAFDWNIGEEEASAETVEETVETPETEEVPEETELEDTVLWSAAEDEVQEEETSVEVEEQPEEAEEPAEEVPEEAEDVSEEVEETVEEESAESEEETEDDVIGDTESLIDFDKNSGIFLAKLAKKKEEEELFGNLPVNPQITKNIWHFMVYGNTNAQALECARERIKEIDAINANCPTRLLKINAAKIARASIVNSLDRFLGNMVIVEEAALLSDEQLLDFSKVLDKDDRSLLIVFTDRREKVAEMLERVPELANAFTAIYEGKRMKPEDLLKEAEEYLYEQDAALTDAAKQVVLEEAERLLNEKKGSYNDAIREFAEAGMKKAEKGGFLGFGSGKIDKNGILQIDAKHIRRVEK